MLIPIPEAIDTYTVTAQGLVRAVNRGELSKHDQGGVACIDTDELDAHFQRRVPLPEVVASLPVAEPQVSAPPTPELGARALPTPDELDAAVARALGL